jgi:hypothetical protein
MNGSRSEPGRTPNRGGECAITPLERLLRRIAREEIVEAALGDLREEHEEVAGQIGRTRAGIWFWSQVLRFAATAAWESLGERRPGEELVVMDTWRSRRKAVIVLAGALACLPAVILVAAGLTQSAANDPAVTRALERTLFNPATVGFRLLLHPVTVVSGLLLAAGLNLYPVLRVGLGREDGVLVGTLRLRLRRAHLAVSSLALALLTVVFGYAFTENYAVVPRESTARESTAAAAPSSAWVPAYQRLMILDDGTVLYFESLPHPWTADSSGTEE